MKFLLSVSFANGKSASNQTMNNLNGIKIECLSETVQAIHTSKFHISEIESPVCIQTRMIPFKDNGSTISIVNMECFHIILMELEK